METLKARIKTIASVKEDITKRIYDEREAIRVLEFEAPRIFAALYLGYEYKGNVEAHKRQIATHHENIDDLTMALQGLDILKAEAEGALSARLKARSKKRDEQHYQKLKVEVPSLGNPATYDRRLESSFRSAAAAVRKQKEASNILSELQKKRDNHCQPCQLSVNHE